VLHDQRTVVRHAGDVARGFGYGAPGTVVMITAPLCGVFGFTNAMGALAAARPLVMFPTFDAQESAQAVLRHRVTHTHASDEMIGRMLETVPGTPVSDGFFGYAAARRRTRPAAACGRADSARRPLRHERSARPDGARAGGAVRRAVLAGGHCVAPRRVRPRSGQARSSRRRRRELD
jgi:acyl-CoA synthetase (AMP-forming)/AMP-acid ligase II